MTTSEITETNQPIRYVALDSLRGICAGMVVLYHFRSQGHLSDLSIIKGGWLFVDFFFVLSGFVIATSYGKRLAEGFPIGRFMWLRIWRVYPLHVVMLAIFIAFEVFFATFAPGIAGRRPFEGSYTLETWYHTLFLVQIYFGPEGAPWNGPSWSIAAEVWTYLLFALLMRFASRLALPVCILVAVVAPLILFSLTDRYMNVLHDGALVRCLFGFSLGVAGSYFAPLIKHISLDSRAMETAVEVAAIAVVVWFGSTYSSGPGTLVAPLVFLMVVMAFTRERGGVSSLLLMRPFKCLGTLSYSIYMIHMFLLYRFVNGLSLLEKITGFDAVDSQGGNNAVGGGVWFSDAMTILFLGIVIMFAGVTYRFIERPGQDFGRRPFRIGKGEPLPATPVAP